MWVDKGIRQLGYWADVEAYERNVWTIGSLDQSITDDKNIYDQNIHTNQINVYVEIQKKTKY